MENYNYLKKSRDKRKAQMVYVMGDCCQLCGYNKSLTALEFHHIDPTQKEFSFNKAENLSWEKIKGELQKCILLCANCHREVEYEDNVLLQSSYNFERADEVSQEINALKTHKTYYCKNCGAIVSKGNDCCPECSSIMKRTVARPDRTLLKELIRNKPFTQIAKEYNVSDNAIRKWCIAYNLPSKKVEINSLSDEEWSKI